ncbi:HAF repeat-containing protein [Cryptosporangium arvum]|uniref:HAF family repeat protein n=1 Tax=Cryptosporangium arvum DSM 44712 TaxID=927661 RepID=A0A011AHY6_9ACTN|nr:HAF repeat-containing protein [Cryptosporangium arvum]EXG81626.1 HAF family repeat protein [Cryptosporangium arvum DSM 44712]
MRSLLCGVVAAALLVPAGTASAADRAIVTVTRLPVPAGTTGSSAADVNDAGVVVGTADVRGVSQALRWAGGSFTRLPASATLPEARAARITDSGLVVGSIESADTTQRGIRYWAPGGATTDCALATGFPLGVTDVNDRGDALIWVGTGPRAFTYAVCHPDGTSTATNLLGAGGIDDTGRVAGFRNAGASTNFQYVPVVAADGTAADLPVPAGQSAVADDIAPDGTVVGSLGTSTWGSFGPVYTPRKAVAWIDGEIVELGGTSATGISRTGDVVGTLTTAGGSTHAFLWRAGRRTDLGTLGGDRSFPNAVNDRGQVVGTSTTASGATHGFRWSAGRLVDLGGPSGTAAAVNDAGVVVGSVTTTSGVTRAVRWTIR